MVICFDNDSAGREAAEKCAQVLSPNKAKIVNLTDFKDASDYLSHNKVRAFTAQWWEAKTYRMTGVITLEDAWSDFIKRGTEEIIPFPESFGMLNSMLNGGIAAGEITVVGALTSVGKTTMVNEIAYHFWKNTTKTIGCAFLEASNGEAVENLLTIHTGHNLSLEDRKNIDFDKLRSEIITDGRILHSGASPPREIAHHRARWAGLQVAACVFVGQGGCGRQLAGDSRNEQPTTEGICGSRRIRI